MQGGGVCPQKNARGLMMTCMRDRSLRQLWSRGAAAGVQAVQETGQDLLLVIHFLQLQMSSVPNR